MQQLEINVFIFFIFILLAFFLLDKMKLTQTILFHNVRIKKKCKARETSGIRLCVNCGLSLMNLIDIIL